jgi:hypothetical protein
VNVLGWGEMGAEVLESFYWKNVTILDARDDE